MVERVILRQVRAGLANFSTAATRGSSPDVS